MEWGYNTFLGYLYSARVRNARAERQEGEEVDEEVEREGGLPCHASSQSSMKSLNGSERARKEAGFTQPLREKYAP